METHKIHLSGEQTFIDQASKEEVLDYLTDLNDSLAQMSASKGLITLAEVYHLADNVLQALRTGSTNLYEG